MPRDTFPLVDRLLDGKLASTLTGLRDEGVSAEQIAYQLRADHDITVSSETVRRWLQRIDAPPVAS